ncbi:hypothetical protein GCM10009764_62480 [Nocardia ninae]|uniref:Uncharacterized protein n=1 Tax=Nocardia ninae NBRC 108245 TaxID=1210091 RepID=A0A511MUD4_9NOCA|nr:hypothetical protein NN4_87320 [Nocardia ninae NBRC 108245]
MFPNTAELGGSHWIFTVRVVRHRAESGWHRVGRWGMRVDWVEPFFDTAPVWWGPQVVRESDRQRAASIVRLVGPGAERILELGGG